MAFDFPASPTPGQTFTPPGAPQTYVWSPPRWTVQPALFGALAALDQVNTPQIVDSAVTTPKIAAGAVTAPKLAAGVAVSNLGYTPANKAGDTFGGAITAPVIYVGDQSMYFQTDTTASYLSLNTFNCRLQYTKATGELFFLVNGANHFYFNGAGSLTIPGGLTVGPGNGMGINTDGTYASLLFDTSNAYFQYNLSNQNLYYVRGGTIRITVGANGDMNASGNLSCAGTLFPSGGVSSGGWLTGGALSCLSPAVLQINGNATDSYFYGKNTGPVGYIHYNGGTGAWDFISNANWVGSVDANGYMNCSVSNVSNAVLVNNSVQLGASRRMLVIADDAGGFSDIVVDNNSNYRLRYNRSTGGLYFYAAGVPIFRLDPNGNLVIKGTIFQNSTPLELDEGLPPPEPFDAIMPRLSEPFVLAEPPHQPRFEESR